MLHTAPLEAGEIVTDRTGRRWAVETPVEEMQPRFYVRAVMDHGRRTHLVVMDRGEIA